MRLGLVALKNYANINTFAEVQEYRVQQGNPSTLYLRLVDLDQPEASGTYLRYVPVVGATMSIVLNHIDSTKVVTKAAAMTAVADDRSIWQIDILSTDNLQYNGLVATLVEGAVTRVVRSVTAIVSDPTNPFYC